MMLCLRRLLTKLFGRCWVAWLMGLELVNSQLVIPRAKCCVPQRVQPGEEKSPAGLLEQRIEPPGDGIFFQIEEDH